MNKTLALQIGLLVSFSSMNGMEAVKGFLGMRRAYSCDYQKDGKSLQPEAISVTIVQNTNTKGVWFSKDDKYHDVEKGMFSLRLGNAKASIQINKECLADVMKTIAMGQRLSIQTVLSDSKKSEPIIWSIQGTGEQGARERAFQYYTHQIEKSLKVANKDLETVTIELSENQSQVDSLQNPLIVNPWGSFGISKKHGFTIPASQSLLHILSVASLLNKKELVIKRKYKNPQFGATSIMPTSGDIVLDVEEANKQLKSYFSKVLWRNRILFGLSFAGIVALLAYFQFNQK